MQTEQQMLELSEVSSHDSRPISEQKQVHDTGPGPSGFFQMSGMPKFGKQWLDNFISDPELQNTFITSEVVRNVLMLQCVFYASVYNDLMLYKHAFLNTDPNEAAKSTSSRNQSSHSDMPPFKIGIVGCGQLGTMILTKLIEVSSSFNNLQIIVSTRQPHLLRPFKQEFGIQAEFNNEKVFAECDIIFVCVLPGQAGELFKEVRYVI